MANDLLIERKHSYLTQLSSVLRDVFVPPRGFDDSALETRFVREFRQSGLSALTAIYLVGVIWVGFMLINEFLRPAQAIWITKFEIIYRIVMLLVLLMGAVTLIRRPAYLADYYWLLGLAPIALCLMILGGSTVFALEEIRVKAFRVVASFVLASTVAYVTTRARVIEIAPWVIISNALAVGGFSIADPANAPFVTVYLTLGNLIGWLMCVYIERRERTLFTQALELERLSAQLVSKAAEADKANQEKVKLLQVVAHDLRQPITSLQLHIAQLCVERTDADNPAQPIYRAKACISMLQEGLDRLLDPSGQELQPHRLELLEVQSFLDRINSVYPNSSSSPDLEIRYFQRRRTLPTVLSNEESMWHVLNNVIANACKFRAQRIGVVPIVLVAVTVLSKYVRIDVIDNGRGIPREHLPLVFAPYWRGAQNVPGPFGTINGLGLGLAIVQETIDQLGNHSIRIDSELGVGTRVRIYVPRSSTDNLRARKHEATFETGRMTTCFRKIDQITPFSLETYRPRFGSEERE
jgi:signal transduction histidine kinase